MNTIAFLPKRLTLPEPATEEAVHRWQRDVTKFLQDVAANAQRTRYDAGRVASGVVSLTSNPVDGDTLTLTVGEFSAIYEFNSVGGVTTGHVSVTIGGSAAATTTALASAINLTQGARVQVSVHTLDTSMIDLAARQTGVLLALAESTSGARITLQNDDAEQPQGTRYQFVFRRVVTAFDVARGRIVIQTALDTILWFLVLVQTSDTIPTATAYNGTVSVTDGMIECDNAGGSDFAAGNVLIVIAEGTRVPS